MPRGFFCPGAAYLRLTPNTASARSASAMSDYYHGNAVKVEPSAAFIS